VFREYSQLPGLIAERLFAVSANKNSEGYISQKRFLKLMD
jgi:hypothetical protein